MNTHEKFYSAALFYDVAFSFKNVSEENQTILDSYRKLQGRAPKSFCEFAAGPAKNAIEMSTRGIRAFAIDCSSEMVAYGKSVAQEKNVDLQYFQSNMCQFALPEKVDCAAIFMDSTSYLLTNDDILSHFNCVADALSDEGLYFLEMSHPRDVFNVGKSASTEWTMQEGEIEVKVKFGEDGDEFDPITQTTMTTAKLWYKSPLGSGEIVDRSPQRCFSFQEFDALVKASGRFQIIDLLGSLKPGIPFSNEKQAWRMIPVLRKIS